MSAQHRRSTALTCLIAAFAVATVTLITAWFVVAVVYDVYFQETRFYIDRGDSTGPLGIFIGDGAFRVTHFDGMGGEGIVTAAYGAGRVHISGVNGAWSAPADAASASAVAKAYDEKTAPILRGGIAVGFVHAPWDASQPVRATALDGAAIWEASVDSFGTQRSLDVSPIEIATEGGKAVVLAQRFITFERGNVVQETASTVTRGLVDDGFRPNYAHRLSAIDETGAAIWERDVAEGRAMWPADGGDEIVYGPDSASLVRIDVRTGEELGPFPVTMDGEWRVRPVIWPAPDGEARTMLVLLGDGVALYDPEGEAPLWRLDLVSAHYGVCAAAAVRFREDEGPSIAVLHSLSSVSSPHYQLWIVDAQGTVVYHEAAAVEASALVAVPQPDGSEALWLVGGGLIKRFEAI